MPRSSQGNLFRSFGDLSSLREISFLRSDRAPPLAGRASAPRVDFINFISYKIGRIVLYSAVYDIFDDTACNSIAVVDSNDIFKDG